MSSKNNAKFTLTNIQTPNKNSILEIIESRIYKAHINSLNLDDKALNDIFITNVKLYIKLHNLKESNSTNQVSYTQILNQAKLKQNT